MLFFYRKFLFFILILALLVIIIGAYTRIADAGLSCPDWPTCYGNLIISDNISSEYTRPLDESKAWIEMIHRYLATILGLSIIVITILSFKLKDTYKNIIWFSLALLILVIFQGLLGMLTVTNLLHPAIVSAHFFGASYYLLYYFMGDTKSKR